MSLRKQVVVTYMDGFRRLDREQILSCLTDDVEWVSYGHKTLTGKESFEGEIENDVTPGLPKLTTVQRIEEGNTVVEQGTGEVSLREGGSLSFVFCDVFTFAADKICRVETYQVNLSGTPNYG